MILKQHNLCMFMPDQIGDSHSSHFMVCGVDTTMVSFYTYLGIDESGQCFHGYHADTSIRQLSANQSKYV